jgi:hypothetical protein
MQLSTAHETLFAGYEIPGTPFAMSTGVGHFQGNKLDVKYFSNGRYAVALPGHYDRMERTKDGWIQYNTKYKDDGSIEYVLATWIPSDDAKFQDFSFELSPDDAAKFNGGNALAQDKAPKEAPFVWNNSLNTLVRVPGVSSPLPLWTDALSTDAFDGKNFTKFYAELKALPISLARVLSQETEVDEGVEGTKIEIVKFLKKFLISVRFHDLLPRALDFGTSGLRGLVTDITDMEAYINTSGYLDYLLSTGGIQPGETLDIARDFRPSSPQIAQAVAKAITDKGFKVNDLGALPTPALTYYAMQNKRVSVMITGSHIPFNRNGIKFNRRDGEVLKSDEFGIKLAVGAVRARIYSMPENRSQFALKTGQFK